jgi:hypothetical protein
LQQPTSAVAGVSISPAVTVQVLDAFGNLVTTNNSSVTVAIGTNPSGGTLSGTFTQTVVGGIATFNNLSIDKVGSGYTLTASDPGLTGDTSTGFAITPAGHDHLAFGVQPTNTTAGAAVSPAVTVQIFDVFGNLVTNDNTDLVTLTVFSGPGGFATGSTATVQAVAGVATFSNLVLNTAGGYTLAESATGGITGPNSSAFTIGAASPDHLVIGQQPTNRTAGLAITPPVTVRVFDRFGNLATNDNSTQVTVSVASGPGGFAGGSATTATVSSGVASFANLVLNTAGNYTLGESATGGLTGPVSTSFTITPAGRDHLAFGIQPATATAGVAVPTVTVRVFDVFGNLATNDNGTQVTLSKASGPGGFAAGSMTTAIASSGVATFSNLVLNTAGTYTLGETGTGGITGPDSSSFTVVPAAGANLVFLQQPSQTAAGAAISPAVAVKIFDHFGNFASNDNTDQVTLSVSTGPAAFAAGSTTTVTAVNGIATFPNLVLNLAGSYTLGEVGTGGITGPDSSSFTIVPAGGDHLVFLQQPSNAAAGAPIGPAVTVKIFDRFGNFANNDNTDQVTLVVNSGPGGFAPTAMTTVPASAGIATFSNLVLNTAGTYTLGETGTGGISGPASTSFTVVPAGRDHLAFGVQPATATAGVAVPTVTVEVFDAFGNFAYNDNGTQVTLSKASGPGGFAAGSATTATVSSGVATFGNLVLNTAGTYTLGETGTGGISGPASNSFTVVPAAGASLVFLQQPSLTVAGAAISPAVTVKIFDRFGNFASNDNTDQVTLFVSTGPAGFAPGSTTTISAVGGVATFANLVLTAAGDYTLGERMGGITGPDSSGFTIVPAGGDHLSFLRQPGQATAGDPMSPAPQVQVFDRFGNFAYNDNSDHVTLTLASGPAGFAPGSITTAIVSAGVATFGNLAFNTTGSYSFVESGTNNMSGPASSSFTVVPAAGASLVFQQQPSNTTAGVAISPAVKVQVFDRFGNFAYNDNTDQVTLSVFSGPGGFTAGSMTTATASGGVATFGNLVLNTTGTYVLGQSATGGVTGPNSVGFTVGLPAPHHLAFAAQPTTTVAGQIIAAVTVRVLDQFGNLETGDTSPVTLALGNNPYGGTLSGTKTVQAVGGIATFNTLSVDKVGASYTLTAIDGGLAGDTSGAFSITFALPAKLGFDVQPTSTTAGKPLSPAVTVKVLDAFGNLVPSDTSRVTLLASLGMAGVSLGGNTSALAVGGVATFNNVFLNQAASGYSLLAIDGNLTIAFSSTFNITPGPADHLEFVQQPSGVRAGVPISPAVTVRVLDAGGNLVTSDNSTVTVALNTNPGGATLRGNQTAPVVGGIATFDTLNLDKAATGYTLLATDGGLHSATSLTFSVTAGQADHLAFGAVPGTARAGVPLTPGVTVRVLDQFGNLVTTDTSKVTVALGNNPGGGTLGGLATVPAVGGVALFSTLSVDKVGVGYTLVASDGGLPGNPSSAFSITPAAADHLAFNSPMADGVAGQALPGVTVSVVDVFGNVVTDDTSSVTVSYNANPGGGALLGNATVPTNHGVAAFTTLMINTADPGYSLAAVDGALSTVSDTFAVLAAAPDHLAFGQQPTNATAGQTLNPTVTVKVFDRFGNLATNDADSILVEFFANPGNAKLGGTTIVPLAGGVASFGDLSVSNVGTNYVLQASDNAGHSVRSASFTITKATTTTAVSAAPTPSVYGQAVTFTATVTAQGVGAGTPNGTVTFVLDGVNQTPVALDANGQATLTTSTLKVATHTLRALYTGNSNFAASNSPTTPLSHVVNKAPTTATLTASNLTPTYGTAITLTVTVIPGGGSTGKPTGTVTFTIDGVKQAPIAINATTGQLALSVKTLLVGLHTITATYNGDVNFNASPASAPVQVNVQPLPPVRLVAAVTSAGGVNAVGGFTITVVAYDSLNNVAVAYNGTADITVSSAPPKGAVTGAQTVTFSNGVAKFTGLRLVGVGTYVLNITSGLLSTPLTLVQGSRQT